MIKIKINFKIWWLLSQCQWKTHIISMLPGISAPSTCFAIYAETCSHPHQYCCDFFCFCHPLCSPCEATAPFRSDSRAPWPAPTCRPGSPGCNQPQETSHPLGAPTGLWHRDPGTAAGCWETGTLLPMPGVCKVMASCGELQHMQPLLNTLRAGACVCVCVSVCVVWCGRGWCGVCVCMYDSQWYMYVYMCSCIQVPVFFIGLTVMSSTGAAHFMSLPQVVFTLHCSTVTLHTCETLCFTWKKGGGMCPLCFKFKWTRNLGCYDRIFEFKKMKAADAHNTFKRHFSDIHLITSTITVTERWTFLGLFFNWGFTS